MAWPTLNLVLCLLFLIARSSCETDISSSTTTGTCGERSCNSVEYSPPHDPETGLSIDQQDVEASNRHQNDEGGPLIRPSTERPTETSRRADRTGPREESGEDRRKVNKEAVIIKPDPGIGHYSHECRPAPELINPVIHKSPIEIWMKAAGDILLRKEVILGCLSALVVLISVSAVIFVYGISDIYWGVVQTWQWATCRSESGSEGHRSTERPQGKQNGRHLTRSRSSSRTSSKKKSRSHSRSKSDQSEASGRDGAVQIERSSPQDRLSKEDSSETTEEMNEWQEVIHSKPKARSNKPKDDPVPARTQPLPRPREETSHPNSPETPPQREISTPSVSEQSVEEVMPAVKPIKTGPVFKESWNFGGEAMASSNFKSGPGSISSVYFSQQQSPFAASTDIPFSSSTPVRSPSRSPAMSSISSSTDEQFQSKIDCLLKNLRSKPFSLHPFSSSPHNARRNGGYELDHFSTNRMNSFGSQQSYSGSLDQLMSSGGAHNMRFTSMPLNLTDDYLQSHQHGNGCPLPRFIGQRSGSLPLSHGPMNTSYPLQGYRSMQLPTNFGNNLSSDCSLFSSNPSIWSMDLAIDKALVKSSLSANPRTSSAGRPADSQAMDLRNCLPDHLLSEVGSYPDA